MGHDFRVRVQAYCVRGKPGARQDTPVSPFLVFMSFSVWALIIKSAVNLSLSELPSGSDFSEPAFLILVTHGSVRRAEEIRERVVFGQV